MTTTQQGRPDLARIGAATDAFDGDTILANADGWWRDCAERALGWLAEAGYDFTAYDLTELGVPDPDVPNRWGSLFSAAHHRGLIEPVGFRVSPRQSRQGGVCRVWRGVSARVDR